MVEKKPTHAFKFWSRSLLGSFSFFIFKMIIQNKKPSHKRVMIKTIALKNKDVFGTDGFYIYSRVFNGIEHPLNSGEYVLKECWVLSEPSIFLTIKKELDHKNIKGVLLN